MSTTPLYPTFEKRIDDATAGIITRQVEPWNFMRQGLKVQRFDGRSISYSGIEFEGSPRQVFWGGYIEPFLQDLVVKELSAARAMAKERDVDGRLVIKEVQGLLTSAVSRVFTRMVDVDRRLRGNGFPAEVVPKPVEKEAGQMLSFLQLHADAELQMWKARPAYEVWYDRNKFFVWVAGVLLALAGLGIKFI